MYQLILGLVVALALLALVGIPVGSNQSIPPANSGTVIIGAG